MKKIVIFSLVVLVPLAMSLYSSPDAFAADAPGQTFKVKPFAAKIEPKSKQPPKKSGWKPMGKIAVPGKVVVPAASRPAPDTVLTGQLSLVGRSASGSTVPAASRPAPDTVRTGQLSLVGRSAGGSTVPATSRPAPDAVWTGELRLIGIDR